MSVVENYTKPETPKNGKLPGSDVTKNNGKDPSTSFDLIRRLDEIRKKEIPAWSGNFAQYFTEIAVNNPNIQDSAHKRIFEAITSQGVNKDGDITSYDAFDGIYGVDKPLQELVEYFSAAAKDLPVKKRALVLVGPEGSGKKTIVDKIGISLEQHSQTPEGAVYAIKGCPIHEEPLHLVPQQLRDDFKNAYGVKIEGSLCPHCKEMLGKDYKGDIQNVPVEQVVLSNGKAVTQVSLASGTKTPEGKDEKVDSLQHALLTANRGILFIPNMLGADKKTLGALITATEEQQVKTNRNAMIDVDTVIIGTATPIEYQNFMADDKNEALKDRIIAVPVPYNLSVSDEVKIYERQLKESGKASTHCEPHLLKSVATVAVLTRIEPTADKTLRDKLDEYDGKQCRSPQKSDAEPAQKPKDGMFGLSPQYIFNAISSLFPDGSKCIGTSEALSVLQGFMEGDSRLTGVEINSYIEFVNLALKKYSLALRKDVGRAFVRDWDGYQRILFDDYLVEDDALQTGNKQVNTYGEPMEPDTGFMGSVEKHVDAVKKRGTEDFRRSVMTGLSPKARKGEEFDVSDLPEMEDGVQRKLIADAKGVIRGTLTAVITTPEIAESQAAAKKKLIEEQGYCDKCADRALYNVGKPMKGKTK